MALHFVAGALAQKLFALFVFTSSATTVRLRVFPMADNGFGNHAILSIARNLANARAIHSQGVDRDELLQSAGVDDRYRSYLFQPRYTFLVYE